MATYSFLDFTATLTGPTGSVNLGQGAATSKEGLKLSMSDDKTKTDWGADGQWQHTLVAGNGAKLTVELLKTSPTNKKLSLMYNAQRLSAALWGNNVVTLRNHTSGDITTCVGVAFTKQPDYVNAEEAGMVSWEFIVGRVDQILGAY